MSMNDEQEETNTWETVKEIAKKPPPEKVQWWGLVFTFVMLLLTGLIAWGLGWAILTLHQQFYPEATLQSLNEGGRGKLLFVPMLFPAFAFAGLFSIILLSKIRVIRRGLNREAEAQGNPKHEQSQKIMWKLIPWIAIPTFTISIIAAVY